MKITASLLLILAFSQIGKATVYVDRIISQPFLTLYLCQNHSNYKETTTLLFQTRAEKLNDYIKQKIANKALKNKIIEIQIYDRVLTYEHLELSQNDSSYLVRLSGYPSLLQLAQIVDYFSKPNWEAFSTSSYENSTGETRLTEIENFYTQAQKFESLILDTSSVTVWKNGSLELNYFQDELLYFYGDQALKIKGNATLPAKIKNRYLVFQDDSIFVLEGSKIINSIKTKPYHLGEDLQVNVFRKWVNIHESGGDWDYSYSYTKNKFYQSKDRNF